MKNKNKNKGNKDKKNELPASSTAWDLGAGLVIYTAANGEKATFRITQVNEANK